MKYTVLWRPIAERHLIELWLAGPDRNAVAAAADTIDAALERDPHRLGEARGAATRVAFEGPLGVLFEVLDADRKVAVLDAWRCR